MHSEILNKLRVLLDSDDAIAARREFNSLKSQFKSLPLETLTADAAEGGENGENVKTPTDPEPISVMHDKPETPTANIPHHAAEEVEKDGDATDESAKTSPVDQVNSPAVEDSPKQPDAPHTASDASETIKTASREEIPEEETKDAGSVADTAVNNPAGEEPAQSETVEASTEASRDHPPASETSERSEPAASEETSVETETVSSPGTDKDEKADQSESAANLDPAALLSEFNHLVESFNEKLKRTREEKEKIERETIATAKALLEEMKSLIADEENIGKAFSRFNAIQARWKSLPKVSNDTYRDLNAEYNKYLEEFFYNINIYKELKELDLKHNLEEKLAILENQKKLLLENDIRLLEVEVRMNQDRWNEIGPTFREEWEKLKDEFWGVTRQIYARIHDFYQDQRKEQEKNLLKLQEILESAKKIVGLELKSTKKWHEKSKRIKQLQDDWKMVGFVSKKESREIKKEFRKLCDQFFDQKRAFHAELKQIQDANRDAKEKLLAQAEALKDSEDWTEATNQFIALQNKWKEIGPAFQRDENRLWKNFRATCNHFFNRRKEHREGRADRELANLEKKKALLAELESLDIKAETDPMETLKTFHERWREIGHIPIKEKKGMDKRLTALMDEKYGSLDVDVEKRRRIRFEEHVENLKESKQSEHLIRKEEDIVRNKISKLESQIHQWENNMGFFADTAGAEKFKKEIQAKIDDTREKIAELKDQIKILRDA